MFTGLSAFPLTPLDDRGALDEPAFVRLVTRLGAAGVQSIGALGSTGSYAYLSRAEPPVTETVLRRVIREEIPKAKRAARRSSRSSSQARRSPSRTVSW